MDRRAPLKVPKAKKDELKAMMELFKVTEVQIPSREPHDAKKLRRIVKEMQEDNYKKRDRK